MSERIEQLIRDLTLDEKASLTAGMDAWHTPGVERLSIPRLKMTDGPVGARGERFVGGPSSACFPCGSALAATWDVDLVQRVGAALGEETRAKGAHVLLAPTVNIHRSPLGGRHFECYSEDPHLTSRMAVAYIAGVQSRGVGACIKHFVCNDSEFERMSIDSQVSERALREIYLPPFEAAVGTGVWSVMAAYNRCNGPFCTEHERLLEAILKREWGFDGYVVSDWGATHSTAAAANAGLDVEMPGPSRFFGQALADAVLAGEVEPAVLDDMARRVLRTLERAGALDDPIERPETASDRPEHRAIAREAATASAVLLKNDGLLPLEAGSLSALAVIGPNADRTRALGGGSAAVTPHYTVSVLDAIRDLAEGAGFAVSHERGCSIDRSTAPLDTDTARRPDSPSEPGVTVEYHANLELSGEPAAVEGASRASFMWADSFPEAAGGQPFSMRVRALVSSPDAGPWRFTLSFAGRARLLVDGDVIADLWDDPPIGGAFFGRGSGPLEYRVDLSADQDHEVVVEYACKPSRRLRALEIGCLAPVPEDLHERALAAARSADAVVLVVGTSADWETEGRDRDDLALPGGQDPLVAAVCAANPRTVVVVNAGSPVSMSWLDSAPAVLWAWYPGQEAGNAIADLLFGHANPSGKLPTTFPRRLQDTPSFLHYPGELGAVQYGEGVFAGYRGYDARDIDPLFCFGHGLSYTTFHYGPVVVPAAVTAGETVEVSVEVSNAGDRGGAEVVQCYVRDVESRLARPPRELKAFTKVWLEPGESREIVLRLDERAFSFYDPSVPGWVCEAGDFEILVGASSRDIRARAAVEVSAG